MGKLVTISREYGSGGRIIGGLAANLLGVPVYDKEIIDMAAKESGLSPEIIETAELRAKNSISYSLSSASNFSDTFLGDTISMNEKMFLAQFDVITEIGDRGEGVVVGRCADYVLRERAGVTNVFIHADIEDRVKRCRDDYGVEERDEKKIRQIIADYDKGRRNFYNYHTTGKWGDYKNYDLSINTSHISLQDAAELIVEFVAKRQK